MCSTACPRSCTHTVYNIYITNDSDYLNKNMASKGKAERAPVRCAGAGGCCWSGVREKHCWLAGGWRLLLEWCERKILLVGAGAKQNKYPHPVAAEE